MGTFSRLRKIVIAGAVSITATYCYLTSPDKKAYASWTTSYEPHNHAKWDDNWDHRSPYSAVHPKALNGNIKTENGEENIQETTSIKPKAIRHLILIRHGQYNLQGNTDEKRILTELGRIQADYTGKRLQALELPYTEMVKSTMARAQETGTIISQSLPELPVRHCDLLREGAPIPPEPPIGSWKQEKHFFVDGARIEAAFRRYFHRADPTQAEDSYTILVCHANVIRYFVCRALQFPAEAWLRISLNHASITWISITPSGRVILRCLGDTGHMPRDAITSH